jgi:hypothetical protein
VTNLTYLESALAEILHRSGSLNCIIIHLEFLLASSYRLKHLQERRGNESFPELVILMRALA